MIPSSSSHEQQQQQQETQQQQQEKKASQLFAQRALQERRLKPPDQVIACPRCQSLNTKFCYYNNYSLTQPRHFCKSCRRYWTAGGTLRNVPVGGGCRKNKRSKPRTPETCNSGAGSDNSSGSLSVPGLQHPGFSSASVGFLSSSEGGSPYGLAEPSMRADSSSMSQSGDGAPGLIPFHSQQSSGLAHHPHSHPQFDGGIPQLNFFRNHSRPEASSNLHPAFQMPGPGDLSEIFDTSTASRVGALGTLNEGLGTFNLNPETRDNNQQPSFVTLERWQAAKQQQQQHQGGGMRESEVAAAQAGMDLNRQDVKGKMTALSMVPVPGMQGRGGQQQQQRPGAPSWQLPAQPQDANPALQHYQPTPEHNYWSNSGWPSMDSQAFQSSGGGQAL